MNRFDRQSFLGMHSEDLLHGATIGLVGLGGGGSHIVQQTGHLGIGGFVIVDPDHITDTNTNRLIGGRLSDLATKKNPARNKVEIANRLLHDLQESPRVLVINDTWHNATEHLKQCKVIVGAVDSLVEREQLERFARQHLIPYIDIGMDVHKLPQDEFLISGQVILSMPGRPCLRCCGLVTDEILKEEVNVYGAAGSRPQVVWSNGILASAAVGLLVQLLTPWFGRKNEFVYLDYDGNRGTLTENLRMEIMTRTLCPHHPLSEVGDPLFNLEEFKRKVVLLDASRRGKSRPSHLSRLLAKIRRVFA